MYFDLVFVMFILFLETNIDGFIGRLMSLDEDCAAVDLSFTIDEVFQFVYCCYYCLFSMFTG